MKCASILHDLAKVKIIAPQCTATKANRWVLRKLARSLKSFQVLPLKNLTRHSCFVPITSDLQLFSYASWSAVFCTSSSDHQLFSYLTWPPDVVLPHLTTISPDHQLLSYPTSPPSCFTASTGPQLFLATSSDSSCCVPTYLTSSSCLPTSLTPSIFSS